MLRPVIAAGTAALLLALSCGDDDKKQVVEPEGGTRGAADGGMGSEPVLGGSTSDGGLPNVPVAGGGGGQPGMAGMPGQAGGGGGESPAPPVLDVGANRGGGRVQAGYHTCVVLASGAVYCAGDNSYDALGHPATTGTNINSTLLPVSGPSGVGELADAEQVALGEGYSCAKGSDGGVWCWGDNLFGQLGDGSSAQASSPVPVLDADSDSDLGAGGAGPGQLKGVTALAAGTLHTCALGSDQFVRCWGQNIFGELGLGLPDSEVNMASRVELPNVVEVGAGYRHTCARTTGVTAAAQTVYCWGVGTMLGQDADVDDKPTPVQVLDDAGTGFINDIVSLAVGGSHTCAAKSDGSVWCWGDNERGQCGTGDFGEVVVPLALPVQVMLADDAGPLDGVSALFAGDVSTCAITIESDVWCWGGNDEGQLGIDSLDNQPNPVQLAGLKASKLSLGSHHSCSIDVAREAVRCWGANWNGQLGSADTVDSLVPQLLPLP